MGPWPQLPTRYNEIEIPLARFIGYSTVNEGATAVLYKDDEEIVKIVVKWGLKQNHPMAKFKPWFI